MILSRGIVGLLSLKWIFVILALGAQVLFSKRVQGSCCTMKLSVTCKKMEEGDVCEKENGNNGVKNDDVSTSTTTTSVPHTTTPFPRQECESDIQFKGNFIELQLITCHHNVREINLSGSKMNQLSKNYFEDFPNVQVINVGYNKISKIDGNIFEHVPKLESLHLQGNLLDHLPNELSPNRKFRKIFLDENKLRYFPSMSLDWESIEEIYLNINLLENLDDNALHFLINLKVLSLSFNKLTTIDPLAFRTNMNAEKIYLNDNQISFLDEDIFKNQGGLQLLDLRNNDLGNIFAKWHLSMKVTKDKRGSVYKVSTGNDCKSNKHQELIKELHSKLKKSISIPNVVIVCGENSSFPSHIIETEVAPDDPGKLLMSAESYLLKKSQYQNIFLSVIIIITTSLFVTVLYIMQKFAGLRCKVPNCCSCKKADTRPKDHYSEISTNLITLAV